MGSTANNNNALFFASDVSSPTTRLTLNNNGALVLQGGDTSASGVGVAFPATQSASSNANTLDDYEEGTWTPAMAGSTTNPTVSYTSRTGEYVKIGNTVYFRMQLQISSVSAQGTGGIQITGLPYTAAGSYENVCTIGYNDVFDTAFQVGYVTGGSIQVIPRGVTQANAQYGTPASDSTSNLSSGFLSISGFYKV
jgi:hypothetical protein